MNDLAAVRWIVLWSACALATSALAGANPLDEGPGIWTHEPAEVVELPAAATVRSARFEPLCVRHGVETFSLAIGLNSPAGVVEIRFYSTLFTFHGAQVEYLSLFDDGADGDAVAGDGVYTVSGLGFADAPNPIGRMVVRYVDIDLVYSDSSVVKQSPDFALSVTYIQPWIPIPPVESLAPDVVASPHAVSIARPLSGAFPSYSIDLTATTRRYYQFFADDRDFLFLSRVFNTGGGPAASMSVVRNDVRGLGLSVFDSSSSYGSHGKLQGVISLYWSIVAAGTWNHEILHRWCCYLPSSLDLASSTRHWDATERPSCGFGGPPAYVGVHDHYDYVSGSEYRGWSDDPGDPEQGWYSDLELYLMGLVDIAAVASPVWTLLNPTFVRYEYIPMHATIYTASGMRGVPTSEITSATGVRTPGTAGSQKSFSSGLIVVYDRVLTATELAYWDYAMAEYEAEPGDYMAVPFRRATGDRATLTTEVPVLSGVVPDGTTVPGTPLRVGKTIDPAYVTLMWDPSCRSTDRDYVVYEGTLGDFASHVPVTCSTRGSTAWTFRAAQRDTYYLVAPRTSGWEGSLGSDTWGGMRSAGAQACLPRSVGPCGSP